MKNYKKLAFIILVCLFLIIPFFVFDAEARSGCCSHHGGVCGCHCCDGSSLSATCAPYYPSCSQTTSSQPKSSYVPIFAGKEEETDYTKIDTTMVSVIEVVDGDTIKIKFLDNTTGKVRMIGIDTPETVDPRKPVQCFGKEASAYLKSLLNEKTITLRTDEVGDKIDKYDRLLRYVFLNNEDINLKMVKDGYAYAYLNYPFDSGKMKIYKEAENYARENKKGLWADNTCGGKTEIKSTTTPDIIQTTTQNITQQKDEVKSNIFVSIKNVIKNFFKKLFK